MNAVPLPKNIGNGINDKLSHAPSMETLLSRKLNDSSSKLNTQRSMTRNNP